MSGTAHRYARVIVDSPLPQLDHLFDYAIPERLHGEIAVGQKVVVPLRGGKRRSDAWIIELTTEVSFSGSIAEIESIVSPVPVLPESLYRLARAVADRQSGSAVDVLRLAIPSRYVRAEKAFVPNETATISSDKSHGEAQRVLQLHQGGVVALANGAWVPSWAQSLAARAEQELYAGRSVILAVPDFRDLQYLQNALESTGVGDSVVRVDAGQSGSERWTGYLRILSGETVIVLGNRSAVYAPVSNLGLIAMWDDGNDAMSEPLAPYAHPRDVALVRQTLEGCSLLFAALVPSPSCARLVHLSFLHCEVVKSRRPKTVPVDASVGADGPRRRIPTEVFTRGKAALQRGPVLIHVAKPGYASTVRCKACSERALCVTCGGPLRIGSRGVAPSCRWCGHIEQGFSCRSCHGHELVTGSPGSEKTAEELGKAFPGARVIIADAQHRVDHVSGANVLVIATPGTEPIAVAGYAAVFILDGEVARSREDIDTDIHAMAAWANAAGLASSDADVIAVGTGMELGRVLATGEFLEFVSKQVREREVLGLPPSTRVAVLTGNTAVLAEAKTAIATIPTRSVLGPVPVDNDNQRLIVTFDYRHGEVVATALRALVVTTARASRKPVPSHERGTSTRVSRLSVRMDDAWLS